MRSMFTVPRRVLVGFLLFFACGLSANPTNVLVTGATGFVGGHVVEMLLARGVRVRVLVRDPSKLGNIRSRVGIVVGDITDPVKVRESVKDVDGVVHAAAFLMDYTLDASQYGSVNIKGTQDLVQAAKIEARNRPLRFLHFSTADVLMYKPGAVVNDDSPYEPYPRYSYPASKIEAEKFVFEQWRRAQEAGNLNFEATAVRPTWIYGPRDRTFFPELIKGLESGTPILIGGRDQVLHLNYIENLMKMVWLLLTHPNAEGKAFLSDDGPQKWGWIVDKIRDELEIPRKKFAGVLIPDSIPSICGWALSQGVEAFAYATGAETRPTLTPYTFDYMFRNLGYSAEAAKRLLGYEPVVASADEAFHTTLQTFAH